MTAFFSSGVSVEWARDVEVIYQEWYAVFDHQMKHWQESWKYDAQWSIFDERWGVLPCDETQLNPWY